MAPPGSGSRRGRPAKPRGPAPPAAASAAADSSEMPCSAHRSAAAAAILESARSACRCDVRLPAPRPVPPGPRLAPVPASAASSAAPPCAEIARNHHVQAPCSPRPGETPHPRHRNRCTAPSRSAGSRPLADTPAVLPADAPRRRPFARILPLLAWSHLPFSLARRPVLRRAAPASAVCRRFSGERVWRCGRAMNHVPFPANRSKCNQSRKADEWNRTRRRVSHSSARHCSP